MASFTKHVYLTTNICNGKIYIGQSNGSNPYYMGSGTAIRKAMKKYGRKNFFKQVLFQSECKDQIDLWEEFYIKLFNSRNSKIGYNISCGGKNHSFIHTEEAINKIKARSNCLDNIIHFREIQKKAAASRIGTHHSKESKIQISKTRHGRARKIEIYDLNNSFVNSCHIIEEAHMLTGISISSIKNNLCNLSKTTKGFIFKYKEVEIE